MDRKSNQLESPKENDNKNNIYTQNQEMAVSRTYNKERRLGKLVMLKAKVRD